jgi:hypothetical protein
MVQLQGTNQIANVSCLFSSMYLYSSIRGPVLVSSGSTLHNPHYIPYYRRDWELNAITNTQ